MRILLVDLPQGHSRVRRRVPAEPLELQEWFRPRGPLEADLDVERRGEQITVRGTVAVQGEETCARCTRPARLDLTVELLLVADRRGSDDPADEAALEQEGSLLYHDGIEINLEDPVREALILEVPVVILCRPDCRGLCPQCGQDRNEGGCSCSGTGEDPRWAALRSLKDEDS